MSHHVSTLLADGGKHLGGDPMFESLGTLQFGRKNEGVEAALVDEGSRFSSSSGDQFGHHLIFRHYKLSDCPFRVLVPQRHRPLQAIDAQRVAKI